MREFISKCIAGGLSAGVVLLWWPVLFDDVDTVTSWFVRGVAWTVSFELLLLALMPFERALWDTRNGERIIRRVGNAGTRLHSGSQRRRMGRLSVVATAALVVPVALLVAGLKEQAPAQAEAQAVAPIKVVRVTKVVRPVTVKKVVAGAPAQQGVTETGAAVTPPEAAPAPVPPRVTEKPAGGRAVVDRTAPVERQSAPEPQPESTPESTPECEADACGSSVPMAVGSTY